MTHNLMYIHGYGSSPQAQKCQQLRAMFPDCKVVAPSLNYNETAPDEVQHIVREMAEREAVELIVGSSLGGYHALCATMFFEGTVWCVNPVHDVVGSMGQVVENMLRTNPDLRPQAETMLRQYEEFDQRVFRRLPHRPGQLHFALSRDDEVLGDHAPLLALFPEAAEVVWRDQGRHTFYCFPELKVQIAASVNR